VVAPVLRRIEQLARDAAKMLGAPHPGGGDDHSDVAFLDFVDRVIGGPAGDRDAPAPEGGGAGGGLLHGTHAPSGLILP
jgi:hypothetical protein